jgi:hypothetical protein
MADGRLCATQAQRRAGDGLLFVHRQQQLQQVAVEI